MTTNESAVGANSSGENTHQLEDSGRPQSIVGGTLIVTGTAVGAGMLSLPMVSAGMWYGWSIAVMLLTWYCMLQVSFYILSLNFRYQIGASFSTFVNDILGPRWNAVNTLLLAAFFYILLYAYISGGSSIVGHMLMKGTGVEVSSVIAGCIFTLVLGGVIALSTRAVDRMVSVLILGMVISFFLSMNGLSLSFDVGNILLEQKIPQPLYLFSMAALPFYLTSFGFQTTVPSLVKYYGKDKRKIKACLIAGSSLIFVFYAIWLLMVFGSLPRQEFIKVIGEGGNVASLVTAIADSGSSTFISTSLGIFANFALATSFLGVGLGLFDFVSDRLQISDTAWGRLKTSAITLLPPLTFASFYPNGFIVAIGYAGLVIALTALILPTIMFVKITKEEEASGTGDGKVRLASAYLIIALGVIYVAADIMTMLGLLPVFGMPS